MTIGPAVSISSVSHVINAAVNSPNQQAGAAGGAQASITDCVVPSFSPETVKRIASLGSPTAKVPTGVSPLVICPVVPQAVGRALAELPEIPGPEDLRLILNLTGSTDVDGDQKWLEEHMGTKGDPIQFAPFYHDFAEAFKGQSNADRLVESSLLGVDSFINTPGSIDGMTRAEKAEALLTFIQLFPSDTAFPRDRFKIQLQGIRDMVHQEASKDIDVDFGSTRLHLPLTPPPTPMTEIDAVREYAELTKLIRQAPGRDDGTEHLFDRQYPEVALRVINNYLHHDPIRTQEYKSLLELVGQPLDALALSEVLVGMDNVTRMEARGILHKELTEWREERLAAGDQEFCLRYYTNCRESSGESTAFPRKVLVAHADRLAAVQAGRDQDEGLGQANARYRRLERAGLNAELAAAIYAQAFSHRGDGIPGLGTIGLLQDELARLALDSLRIPAEHQSELVDSALRQRRPDQSLEEAFVHARLTWELFQDFNAGNRLAETVRAAMQEHDFGPMTEEELVQAVEVRATQHIVMGRAASEAVEMALQSVLKEQKAAADGTGTPDVPAMETSQDGQHGIRIGGVWIPVREA